MSRLQNNKNKMNTCKGKTYNWTIKCLGNKIMKYKLMYKWTTKLLALKMMIYLYEI